MYHGAANNSALHWLKALVQRYTQRNNILMTTFTIVHSYYFVKSLFSSIILGYNITTSNNITEHHTLSRYLSNLRQKSKTSRLFPAEYILYTLIPFYIQVKFYIQVY